MANTVQALNDDVTFYNVASTSFLCLICELCINPQSYYITLPVPISSTHSADLMLVQWQCGSPRRRPTTS